MDFDLLGLCAHPDDAELVMGGTLIRHARRGRRIALVDLTRGEMGSRGTPEIRAREAADSARILGVGHRETLGLPDARLTVGEREKDAVVGVLRRRAWSSFTFSGLGLLALTVGFVFAATGYYNLTYVQAQGRYLFPAMGPIALLFVRGLREVVAPRHAGIVFFVQHPRLMGVIHCDERVDRLFKKFQRLGAGDKGRRHSHPPRMRDV